MEYTATTVAGSGRRGFADGSATAAEFSWPLDVVVTPDGTRFIADTNNNRVRRVAAGDGAVSTVAGTGEIGGTDGPGEIATFNCPIGITVSRTGIVFVTEFHGHRVRRIAPTGGGWRVTTVVAAGLRHPRGIAVDGAGQLVVADSNNHRVVRASEAGGPLTVVAGDGTMGFRDGPAATARFNYPEGVAVDLRNGDILVADLRNHRVRRIAAADGSVFTVAGAGKQGDADGPGAAAQFLRPWGIAVDRTGVVVVTEDSWVRRIAATADRTVTTVASIADKGHHYVHIRCPGGCAIDVDGGLLIVDARKDLLRRITGVGLAPPRWPQWSIRVHRELARADPEVATFVTTVMLCAHRIDTWSTAMPAEMWAAILAMLRPDQMHPGGRW